MCNVMGIPIFDELSLLLCIFCPVLITIKPFQRQQTAFKDLENSRKREIISTQYYYALLQFYPNIPTILQREKKYLKIKRIYLFSAYQ